MNNTAKVLFVIDGVAERKTSCMLNDYLVPRLNFSCFMRVVANYVLAFDLVTNFDFDAIVLPRTNVIDHFSTDDFVDVMTNLADFTGSLIHTVDHDSTSHVHGRTVRSSKSGSGGYVIDDLLAAISFAAEDASLPEEHHNARLRVHHNAGLPKSNKRPRRDFVGTSRFPVASEQNQQRPSKHSKHEQDHPPFSFRAEEAAYLQYRQWYQLQQWQLYVQAQVQGLPRTPAVVTNSTAVSLSPIISTSTIPVVPTIPSPLPILHYPLHPYYPNNTHHRNHHNRTSQPFYLDHQFPVFHPHLPLPILGGQHPHHYYLEPPQQPLYYDRQDHLHSTEVHCEQGCSVRADSCSAHSTHSTTSTSSTTESDTLLTTEEAAIPHATGLTASAGACNDSLSTMSMEDRDELFEFMHEDLWDF